MVLKITDRYSNSFKPLITNNININYSLNESKKENTTFDISNLGELLSELKRDKSNISINQIESKFSLNWEYSKSINEKLNLYTEYNYNNKTLTSEFVYDFSVEQSGTIKKFQMKIDFEVKNINSISKKNSIVKEDIVNFVGRIANKVLELAKNKKFDLKNIELDEEDLEEIMKYEDGKGKKVLLTLFNMIIQLAQMQNYSKLKEKNAKAVIYKPERQKYFEKEINIKKNDFIKFNLNIKELM